MPPKVASILFAQIGAGIMLYAGFLRTKETPIRFFVWLTTAASAAWLLAGFGAQAAGTYAGAFAMLALAACWQFRKDNVLNGKLWLSLGSSMGGTMGFLLVAFAPPVSLPDHCPPAAIYWFLAWHYAGGAALVTTIMAAFLAYFAGKYPQISTARLRQAVIFVFGALTVRFLLAIALLLALPHLAPSWALGFWNGVTARSGLLILRLILGLVLPASLACVAFKALPAENRGKKTAGLLILAAIAAIAGESLAQLLYF